MEYYPILKDQKETVQRPLYRNRIFMWLFLISLSMNGYFIFASKPQKPAVVQAASSSDKDIETKEEEAVAVRVPVTVTLDNQAIAKAHQEVPEIRKASFTKPLYLGGQRVHALHFDVENSLNHTLCQRMSKNKCGLMTAYTGRILAWYFDVGKDIRKGDTGDLIYMDAVGEEQFRILKLDYHSRYLGKTLQINYYKGAGFKYGSYFDADGKETVARITKSQSPIRDYEEITSLPGDFRKGVRNGHAGTDFKATVGSPVYSSFDGRVKRTNWNRRMNGYCIEIDHPGQGIRTIYLHLNRVQVKSGEYVKQGQQVGESGNTGRSFAPHLHYEVQARTTQKKIYNPFEFKIYKTYKNEIPAELMPDFRKVLETYDSTLQQS